MRMRSDSYYWKEKKCVCVVQIYVRCYRVLSFIFSIYVIHVFVFQFSVPSNLSCKISIIFQKKAFAREKKIFVMKNILLLTEFVYRFMFLPKMFHIFLSIFFCGRYFSKFQNSITLLIDFTQLRIDNFFNFTIDNVLKRNL